MKSILTLFAILFLSAAFPQSAMRKPLDIRVNEKEFAKFLNALNTVQKKQNIDSLDLVFGEFTKNKIQNNQLKEGQEILDAIIVDKRSSDTLIIFAYKHKAIMYGQLDLTERRMSYEKAIDHINRTQILASLKPFLQLEVARTYLAQNRYLSATNELNKVNMDEISEPFKKVEIMNTTAMLYAKIDDTTQAFAIFAKAINIATAQDDFFGLGMLHSSLGNIYADEAEQYAKSNHHFRLSMAAFQKAGYEHYVLGSQTDIGIVFARQEIIDSAFYYLEKSYLQAKTIGSAYDQSICAKELGILYNKLNEPKKALEMCREAKKIIWEHASHSFKNSCANCLSKAFESIGQYDSSLYYFKIYHAYLDSNFTKAESKAVAKFNAELEKQAFISNQESDKLRREKLLSQRKSTIQFLSVSIPLLVLVFIFIIRTIRLGKKRELIEQSERAQRLYSKGLLESIEHERKRISMELHDSVGQMLVVAGRNLHENRIDQVKPALQNALNEVRSISQGMHPYILEKRGLRFAINNLVHQADSGTNMFINTEIDEIIDNLSKEQEIHIYRILQELISNSIKHAESPSLEVFVESSEKMLSICVRDKGKGMDLQEIKTRKTLSLGWKTLHERVQMLEGTIQIQSRPKEGTTVSILIPKQT